MNSSLITKNFPRILLLTVTLITLLTTATQATTTNLALNKPTIQSSTQSGGVSSRAVDGNTSGNYSHNSTTHTQSANKVLGGRLT